MKTVDHIEKISNVDIESSVRYGIVAANFAEIVARRLVPEDEYTAALVNLLNAYPPHFIQRREIEQLSSAGLIIRQDVDAIIGESCPLTVDEVGSRFTHYIRDETGLMLAQSKVSPIERAAVLTLADCIDQFPVPRVM